MSTTALELSSGVTAVFIIGMIWLRTRMQYLGLIRRAPGRKLQLEKAGRTYFAAAAVLLIIGWFAAPAVGAALWPATAANAASIGGNPGGIGANAEGIGGNAEGIGGNAEGIGGKRSVANRSVANRSVANGTVVNRSVANPALFRVIWFLLTYYVFIFVHRVLLARGIPVFKMREAGAA